MAKAWGQMLACVRNSRKRLVDSVRGQRKEPAVDRQGDQRT